VVPDRAGVAIELLHADRSDLAGAPGEPVPARPSGDAAALARPGGAS